MSIFCRLKLVTGIKFPVENKPAAHTCTDKKADHIPVASCSTVFVFAENAEIHIVPDIKRDPEFLFHRRANIVVPPGKIRREEYNTVLLVNDTRCAGGYGMNIFFADTGFLDHLFHNTDDDFFNILGRITFSF